MKKLIFVFGFLFLGLTSSCPNNEFSVNSNPIKYLGSVDTRIATILDYSVNTKGEYLIYGLTQDNQLVRQLVSIYDYRSRVENKETSTIYHFDKSIPSNHIAFDGSKVAYIKNNTVYFVDTNTDVFKLKTYQDKIIEESNLLMVKIINNSVQVFCKQGKNNYFIYKLSDKKAEKIEFNFAPGTVINNFKIKDDKYLISGYIKDPFLNDQYAYFTKADLKGKMKWEKQEGKSNAMSVGFDMNTKHNLLYSIDNIINGSQIGNSDWSKSWENLKNISDARVINKNDRDIAFFLGNNHLYFFKSIKSADNHILINFDKLDIMNVSIVRNRVPLVQDSILPYMFITEKSYKKGDGFQLEALKKDDFNFYAISFSGDGNIDTFFPKKTEDKDKNFLMPSKETKFEKIDGNDEYLLLLYSKDKMDFITKKQWNSVVIKNISLFLSVKSLGLDYGFEKRSFSEQYNPRIYVDFNKPLSIIPVLIKIKGTNNSKTNKND